MGRLVSPPAYRRRFASVSRHRQHRQDSAPRPDEAGAIALKYRKHRTGSPAPGQVGVGQSECRAHRPVSRVPLKSGGAATRLRAPAPDQRRLHYGLRSISVMACDALGVFPTSIAFPHRPRASDHRPALVPLQQHRDDTAGIGAQLKPDRVTTAEVRRNCQPRRPQARAPSLPRDKSGDGDSPADVGQRRPAAPSCTAEAAAPVGE